MKSLHKGRITKCPRNDIKTRFGSGEQHPRYRSDEQLLIELAKHPLKSLELTGRIERRARSRRYCEVICSECKQIQWILADNILSNKTKNCRCQRHRKYPINSAAKLLGQRYDAMKQRCERDTHVSSHNYKDRGIKVLFYSRRHFIDWALKKWGSNLETYKNKHFDRANNDGDYEPDNLGLVTPSENMRNRRSRDEWSSRQRRIIRKDTD